MHAWTAFLRVYLFHASGPKGLSEHRYHWTTWIFRVAAAPWSISTWNHHYLNRSCIKSSIVLLTCHLGGGFKYVLFSTLLRENDQIWRAYFLDGLVQPPTIVIWLNKSPCIWLPKSPSHSEVIPFRRACQASRWGPVQLGTHNEFGRENG